MKKYIDDTFHFRFGGSTATRTMNCAAWPSLSDSIPDKVQGANAPADKGTLLHNCMEEFMMDEVPFETMLEEGRGFNDQVLEASDITNKLRPALEALQELESLYHIVEFDCEPSVKYSDEIGGSIDYIGLSKDGKTAVVADYKFGHVQVNKVDQLMFYAAVAAIDADVSDMFDKAESVILSFIQPNDQGDVLLSVEVSMEDVADFLDAFLEAVNAANAANPEANPGDWCNYCPAQSVCPAMGGMAKNALLMQTLDIETLEKALPMLGLLEAWIKAVKKTAHEQLEQGATIQGWKLVNKRATRVWNDTDAVADKIRKAKKIKLDQGFDIKLKSPAQLEKTCKELGVPWGNYDGFVSKISTGTTLAPDSDKRAAILIAGGDVGTDLHKALNGKT